MIATTAAMIIFAGAASANGLDLVGGVNYATQAGVIEATAGVEYTFNDFTISPLVTVDDSTGEFDLRSVDLTVSYAVNQNVSLYVSVDGDRDLTLNETTVGVAFRF
jgi:predicted porin